MRVHLLWRQSLPYHTDERLKSYLDTNQLHREQMCRAILAIDKRFTDVRPRHPRGGPDGGRDIEAVFRQDQKAYGAVGFVNQANDSDEQKKKIKSKFMEDLENSLTTENKPKAFIFFTNINFTISEKDELLIKAKNKGLLHCEVMDRERIRIVLDSADGFAIRFQYLQLPLSEAEQASFFAKWGDDIQSIISTGFQRVEKILDRVLFLQEAADVMSALIIVFELDRCYTAEEIGHFRAFCYMHLKEPKHRIFGLLFGSSDKSYRMRSDQPKDGIPEEPSGIKYGIGGGQWEQYIDVDREKVNLLSDEENRLKYNLTGSSSSIGMDSVKFLQIKYDNDELIRFRPRLSLRDINDSMLVFVLNKSLADKVKTIHIYGWPYKLQEIGKDEFRVNGTYRELDFPVKFAEEEILDPWTCIRPNIASMFEISFAKETPRRMFAYTQTPNSLLD